MLRHATNASLGEYVGWVTISPVCGAGPSRTASAGMSPVLSTNSNAESSGVDGEAKYTSRALPGMDGPPLEELSPAVPVGIGPVVEASLAVELPPVGPPEVLVPVGVPVPELPALAFAPLSPHVVAAMPVTTSAARTQLEPFMAGRIAPNGRRALCVRAPASRDGLVAAPLRWPDRSLAV